MQKNCITLDNKLKARGTIIQIKRARNITLKRPLA